MKVTRNNSEIEGTPEEIHNFCQNNGMDITEFFITPKPLGIIWIIIPIIVWGILLSTAVLCEIEQVKFKTLIFFLMSGCSIWIGVVVKKKYDFEQIFITLALIVLSLGGVGFIAVDKIFEFISKIK